MTQPRKNKAVFILIFALICAAMLCASGCSRGALGQTQGGKESATADSFSYISRSISTGDVSVSARSAILIECDSGQVLWSKNADQRLPMASTTKIMTALVALESTELSRVVTVSPDAVGVEGSSIYLYAGEEITVEDLLYATLLSSANDAAAALAIEIGGSIEGFADMMNQRAHALGLCNTHFTNPHGLDDPDHYTTARELAIIAREAMKNETFAKIVSTYKMTAQMRGDSDGTRLFVNHNKLLLRYEGACGIKTGFTKKSGRCLVSAARREGVSLLCVTLSAPDDWRDHESLLDYGFSLLESRLLCAKEQIDMTLPVVSGLSDHVKVTNSDEVLLTTTKDASRAEVVYELDRFVYAPVREGQVLGRAVWYINGKEVAETPLIAKLSVDLKKYSKGILGSLFD